MKKWPENLETRFFDKVLSLSDESCNELIVSFCSTWIRIIQPEIEDIFLKSINKDKPSIFMSIFGYKKNYWEFIVNRLEDDPVSQKISSYAFWASQNHYQVDGAAEVLDDLVDTIADLEFDIEDIFLNLFQLIDEVESISQRSSQK